jgi:hypothetical protein
MKKYLSLYVCFMVLTTAVFSQKNLQFHIGADLILGANKNAYSGGAGGAVAYGFSAKKNGSAMVQVAYNGWKNKFSSAGNLNFLMLQFGYKQGLGGSPLHLNVRTGGGYSFFGNGRGNHGHFNFTTGLGYLMKTKGKGDGLDLNLDWSVVIGGQTGRGFLMLSLGYILDLKK